MAGTVMPSPVFVGLDNSGNPISGGLLNAYAAGTSDRQATYSDAALASANANPVVLDSAGRAVVYLSSTSYKFVLTNADASVTYWTRDNVSATQLTQVIANEHVALFGTNEVGDNATAYPSGATGDVIVPGSKLLSLLNTNMTGTWELEGMLRIDGTEGSEKVTVAFINLTDAPTPALVEIDSTSTVGARDVSAEGITFATGTKTYGCKIKSNDALNYAYAWGLSLVRTA